MKLVIVTLAIVFNLSVVVLYSRGLVGGGAPSVARPAAGATVPERSASSPYTPPPAQVDAARVGRPVSEKSIGAVEKTSDVRDAKVVVAPASSGDGKETLDAQDSKDAKELQPVAQEARTLGLRSPFNRRTTELLPGPRESRGILAPANRANLDPPIVSPEAR